MRIYDNKKEVARIFNLSANEFMDGLMTVILKRFYLDIIRLDKWMVAHKGYDIDKDGSLCDFIRKTYGDEAVKFLEENT
ncbi:MAG: hypothetical protein WCP55_05040 [Lentisphaerota bacterium]